MLEKDLESLKDCEKQIKMHRIELSYHESQIHGLKKEIKMLKKCQRKGRCFINMNEEEFEKNKAQILDWISQLEHDVELLTNIMPTMREKSEFLSMYNYHDWELYIYDVCNELEIVDF